MRLYKHMSEEIIYYTSSVVIVIDTMNHYQKKMFFLPFLRACLSAGFVRAESKRLSTCEIVYVCVCVRK